MNVLKLKMAGMTYVRKVCAILQEALSIKHFYNKVLKPLCSDLKPLFKCCEQV